MINLAICSTGELYGGVEEWIYTFCHYRFISKRYKLKILLFNEGRLAEKLRAIGVEPIVISGGKYNPFLLLKIYRFFKKHDISIVHTHGYKADIMCLLPAKLLKLRTIKTEHGAIELSKDNLLSALKMFMNIFLDRLIEPFFDKIVFVSNDLMRLRKKQKKNWTVIYNSIIHIKLSDEYELIKERKKDDYVIGIVGRLTEVKGHIFLLKAVMKIKEIIPNLKVWIIGDGRLKELLQNFSVKNGLEDCIEFLGFKKNIYDYIKNFDLFCMPSLHEGLPYTLLEAAYLQVPIVASAVGGLREVLNDGEDALLFEKGDIDMLSKAILRLYNDKEMAKCLAENMYKKVINDFMIEKMIENYLVVYNEYN